MAGLADWLEDYRNWRGRQDWESGKGWQDFFGGDPRAQEQFEKLSGFGTDAGGLVGMIKASHGSPHAFTKFDLSKIGTGEGAQAYGHGGYFAQGFDSPVAVDYQQALAGKEGLQSKIGGKLIGELYQDIERKANRMPHEKAAPEYEKLSFLEDLDQQSTFQHAFDRIDDDNIKPWAESLRSTYEPAGHLYNVELKWPDAAREASDPLGEHHLLDWDARLSEQPELVRSQLLDVMRKRGLPTDESGMPLWASSDPTGEAMYAAFNPATAKNNRKAQELASKLMQETGIPGIRYLDQGSRGAGSGTRNYVIFDQDIPNIVSRNGVSLSDLLRR